MSTTVPDNAPVPGMMIVVLPDPLDLNQVLYDPSQHSQHSASSSPPTPVLSQQTEAAASSHQRQARADSNGAHQRENAGAGAGAAAAAGAGLDGSLMASRADPVTIARAHSLSLSTLSRLQLVQHHQEQQPLRRCSACHAMVVMQADATECAACDAVFSSFVVGCALLSAAASRDPRTDDAPQDDLVDDEMSDPSTAAAKGDTDQDPISAETAVVDTAADTGSSSSSREDDRGASIDPRTGGPPRLTRKRKRESKAIVAGSSTTLPVGAGGIEVEDIEQFPSPHKRAKQVHVAEEAAGGGTGDGGSSSKASAALSRGAAKPKSKLASLFSNSQRNLRKLVFTKAKS
jgi:hypothetical protein